MSECHPDRPHKGQGLCDTCLSRSRRSTPEGKAKVKLINDKNKEYKRIYDAHPERRLKRKLYKQSDRGKVVYREIAKRCRSKDGHKVKLKEYSKLQYVKDSKNKRRRERYASDLKYKIKVCLRSRLLAALKLNPKTSSAITNLGCSVEYLKIHLESKFQPGMTWENWSHTGWHIDHISPLASAKSPEELIKLSHYSNLQPLWAVDNIKKSDKVIT